MLDHPHQLQVGVEGLPAAAQHAGVARLEAGLAMSMVTLGRACR